LQEDLCVLRILNTRLLKLYILETFAKHYKNCNNVIPAEAGIQWFQGFSGFRIKSGMTEKGLIQRSHFSDKVYWFILLLAEDGCYLLPPPKRGGR
jgi:hypothetical protein